MVRAGCVFVAGIHPSRTWTPGSFESVRWNTCVHRLDLGLCSHPKEFWGNGVWTHVNSKGKILSTGKCPQRRIEPTTLWTASPSTTNWAIPAPWFDLICQLWVEKTSWAATKPSDQQCGNPQMWAFMQSWQPPTSSSMFQPISLGFTTLGETFAFVTIFLKSNHRGSHILSSWMVHAGVSLLPAFTRIGHECQDLLSLCNAMHVCTN